MVINYFLIKKQYNFFLFIKVAIFFLFQLVFKKHLANSQLIYDLRNLF